MNREIISPDLINLFDYERHAKNAFMNDNQAALWHYISGGSGDEVTLNANRVDIDKIKLLPSTLTGNKHLDTTSRLFTHPLPFPLLLAPVAYQKLTHESGEIGSLHAAFAQDIGFCLSTLSSTSIEDIGSQAQKIQKTAPLYFQLYCQPNIDTSLDLIKRAEAAGFEAIMITIDAPINGLRNKEARAGFALPKAISAVILSHYSTHCESGLGQTEHLDKLINQAPTWRDIEQLIKHTSLPVILKGILNPADAMKAQTIGAQGVVVSNHGGRVLDSVPSSIHMLPLIRQAVGNDFTLLFDSGIRRGSDIFKAIALGADACLLGRPVMHALKVAGPLGVAHSIKILKDELRLTMALMGCASLSDITPNTLLAH